MGLSVAVGLFEAPEEDTGEGLRVEGCHWGGSPALTPDAPPGNAVCDAATLQTRFEAECQMLSVIIKIPG